MKFVSALAAWSVLGVRCSGRLQEQIGFGSGLVPNLPLMPPLSASWCWLRTWDSWVGDRGLVPHGTAKPLCVGLGSPVPQEWQRGPGRRHASSGAASQPGHPELSITSGNKPALGPLQAALRSGPGGEHSRTTFLANLPRTCRGAWHPRRRASAGTQGSGFPRTASVHTCSQASTTRVSRQTQRNFTSENSDTEIRHYRI